MKKQVELSIIVLCYMAEKQIVEFTKELKRTAEKLTDSFEIILVANYIEGSGDKTGMYVEEIAKGDSVFKTVCKPKEGMMGWDMKQGLSVANGKLLCVIDGDGQFPIEAINQCFEIIKKGSYGLVKTYRDKRNDGFYRKFISVFYNSLFSILFPSVKSKDINSKPKIFPYDVYKSMVLTSDDWFIDAEIMLNINKLGIKYHEFPVVFYELHGRTSFVKFSAIFEFIRNLFLFRFIKE
jgi:glycosyltransferase involved in cell wall biosynthesis